KYHISVFLMPGFGRGSSCSLVMRNGNSQSGLKTTFTSFLTESFWTRYLPETSSAVHPDQ
ncbi:hypothetical protein, partial [Cronobacter sakazakii]